MKKSKLVLVMLLSALFVGFTSCNKDDDKDTPDYASEIVGTYNGSLTLLGDIDTPIPGEASVEVTRNGNDDVTLRLPKLDVLSFEFENITCESKVSYNEADKTYITTGNTSISMVLVQGTPAQELPVQVNGTFKNGTANLAIIVQTGMVNLTVKFTGTL